MLVEKIFGPIQSRFQGGTTMFNKNQLKKSIEKYKESFIPLLWENEAFKWKAIKCFQDNWDVNASDFAETLAKSLAKSGKLLAATNTFPAKMIQNFAKAAPEEVRAMFIALYDESKDVVARIMEFKNKSEILLQKYGNGAGHHFQTENAISTYLWLRYPEKYYIYKFGEVKAIAEELDSKLTFKKGAYAENLRNFYALYDAMCEEIRKDDELLALVDSQLDDSCYPDKERRTLTVDVGFYISRYIHDAEEEKEDDLEGYWPSQEEYSLNLTKEDWKGFILEIEKAYHTSSMQMLKALMEQGGEASCKQLADIYGGTTSRYIGCAVNLGKRVKKYFDLPSCMDGDTERFFVFPFLGKRDTIDGASNYFYRIRPELQEALTEIDLSDVALYVKAEEQESESCNYWWLNANPKIWSFSEITVGEDQSYTLYNDRGNKRKIFQNFLDVKAGDKIICYESNPVKQVVALARISAEQDGEQIWFEKTETLATPIDYARLKVCRELENMEYFVNSMGSLFKLTKEEYDFIYDIIREENPVITKKNDEYTRDSFLGEVYMNPQYYDSLVTVLKNKKNIILQGAPGVGKTFAARRLAYSIMGEKDDSRVEFVQFHQSYSYEDFVMGYKPEGDGFELKRGIFYQFCEKAKAYPEKDYFFIIDEINRGNLSKIFGELLMLIERDWRGTSATLAYNGQPFFVSKNVYIIGMMNTADRSLAMIDYALRRRFSFFDIEPGFDSEGFCEYKNGFGNEIFSKLIAKVEELNRFIREDKSLGKGFCIGHSYFCNQKECTEEWMRSIVEYEILPMLREYWFDDEKTLNDWENKLRGVFQ